MQSGQSLVPIEGIQFETTRSEAELKFTEGQRAPEAEKFPLFQQAFDMLDRIPAISRSHDDHRNLAKYRNAAGKCQELKMQYAYFKSAYEHFSQVPMAVFTDEDWRNWAMYSNNTAQRCPTRKERKFFLTRAVQCFYQIPQDRWTDEDRTHCQKLVNQLAEAGHPTPKPEKLDKSDEFKTKSRAVSKGKSEMEEPQARKRSISATIASLFKPAKKSDVNDESVSLIKNDDSEQKIEPKSHVVRYPH